MLIHTVGDPCNQVLTKIKASLTCKLVILAIRSRVTTTPPDQYITLITVTL